MAEEASKKPTRSSSARQGQAKGDATPDSGTLKIDEVQKLVQLMVDNDLSELDVKEGDRKVHLKRGGQPTVMAPATVVGPAVMPPAAPAAAPPAAPAEAEPADSGLTDISSPMVGTYYTAPSPDSFVAVGDVVGVDDVVCIIEAMKVMNEIRAECAGTIAEICVKNAQPVEFGQALFKVKPA